MFACIPRPGGLRSSGSVAYVAAVERVQVGWLCDECGGSGVLPDRKCPMCRGAGSTMVQTITRAEFQRLAATRTLSSAEDVLLELAGLALGGDAQVAT